MAGGVAANAEKQAIFNCRHANDNDTVEQFDALQLRLASTPCMNPVGCAAICSIPAIIRHASSSWRPIPAARSERGSAFPNNPSP
jgi:hypothetical protein